MDEHAFDRPLLVFDGECSFCRAWVDYWKQLTGDRVHYMSFQDVGQHFSGISKEEFAAAVKLILPDGEVRSGASAVFSALEFVPGKWWMLWVYTHIPGSAFVSETVYRIIARHRSLAYHVTKLLWGIPLEPQTYRVSSWLFLRLLAAIYLIAFASFGVQAAGLIGTRGILPVADFLRGAHEYFGRASYWNVPTVFWLNAGNAFIRAVWIAGICLSVLLLLGISWYAIRILLFLLYLSLVTAGQVFMGYQWDALLLEAGFLAIFLRSSPIIAKLFRWLLFRLMFLSGAVKLLSGDPSWRSFTALPVHYETQPLPTPLAWYLFQAPPWFQHFSVGFLFFVELVVPFLVFALRRIRHSAAFAITLLQVLIFLTGNYAFFNLLAISLCIFLLDDAILIRILPGKTFARVTTVRGNGRARLRNAVCGMVGALVFFVSSFQLAGMFWGIHWTPADAVMRAISPFEIVNTYGLFAVMTTSRPEIIIEGSNDGMTWLPYEFKYKPGNLARRPTWVEPHQPRLDWQMWFAALGGNDPWVIHFMARVLQGSPEVLRLLSRNPFPKAPPHYVRALLYEYRFTTKAEREVTGEWWHRESKQMFVPPIALRDQ